jgi:hypothetical protein
MAGRYRAAIGTLAVLAGLSGAAPAAKSPYLGTWLIAEAHIAPWAEPGAPKSTPESRQLVGKKLIYAPRRISGPIPLACNGPNYKMHDAPIDELFQGTLTKPKQQAVALGFHGAKVPTLETGCAGWIDFHYTDKSTALFALNNMIYTLRRQ